MTPERLRAKAKQLADTRGRTEAEAETFRRVADQLKKNNPEVFAEATPAPKPLPLGYPARPRPRGTLSEPLVLDDSYLGTYRWLIAFGVALEFGCLVVRGEGSVFLFGTAPAVSSALDRAIELLLQLEAEVKAAQARRPLGQGDEDSEYSIALYRRAWVAGALYQAHAHRGKVARAVGKQHQKHHAAAVAAAGWVVVERPPDDVWAAR